MPGKPVAVRPFTFFVLTYVLSWLVWIPLLLSHLGIGPFHVAESTSSAVRLLGVLMPAVAGLVLTAFAGRRVGLGRLLQRLAMWRVGWPWWGAVVLVQPVLLVATALVYNVLGGTPPVTPLPLVSVGAVVVNVVFLAIASLGEEIGWRGVALPSLQRQHGPVVASLILAVLWATWHLPFWLLLDTWDQYGLGYLALNYLFVFPLTFYITWFFNHARSSILLPVVFHVVFNIVNTAWLPVTATPGPFAVLVVVEWGVGLWLLRRLEPEDLKAARLKTMGAA